MIVAFIIISILAFMVYLLVKKRNLSENGMVNNSVNQIYESPEGKFIIEGKRNSFRICKDNNIEFLVENGQIVACRDKRVSSKFKFYRGEKNGTV